MKRSLFLLLPLIPLAMGIVSTLQQNYNFTRTIELQVVCLAITVGMILWLRRIGGNGKRSDWLLAVAYVCCMIGDAFLFHRGDSATLFVLGIAAFALTHVSYLSLLLCNGRLNRSFFAGIVGPLLAYYLICLLPLPDMAMALKVAVLVYLLLSCLTLSAATGLRTAKPEKALFIAAVASMFISDTTISFKEFVRWETLNFLLMPTYFYSLILMCAGMCLKLYHAAGKAESAGQGTPSAE